MIPAWNDRAGLFVAVWLCLCGSFSNGCRTPSQSVDANSDPAQLREVESDETTDPIRLASLENGGTEDDANTADSEVDDSQSIEERLIEESADSGSELSTLESLALSANPKLLRLQQEAAAAWAKTRYIDKLPDPTLGANVFGHPIETAAGSQRASMTVMQMIPWLDRLNAQQQQACFEAMAMQQMYAAERLRVIGDLRAAYYRLYILLLAALGLAQRLGWITGGGMASPAGSNEGAGVYTCPMHPQIRQPEPGNCPICGMALVPATSGGTVDLDELAGDTAGQL